MTLAFDIGGVKYLEYVFSSILSTSLYGRTITIKQRTSKRFGPESECCLDLMYAYNCNFILLLTDCSL